MNAMAGVPVLRHEMDHDGDPSRLTYTFGGAEPVASLAVGSILDTSTLDCFAGRVRTVHDLVSEVCDPRFSTPKPAPSLLRVPNPATPWRSTSLASSQETATA